jgi:hypothetical protein
MAPPQTRDWAPRSPAPRPLQLPSEVEPVERYQTPYLVAVAWGTAWRYGVVGAAVLLIFAGLRPPVALAAVVGIAGFLAGLWFRRPWWAGAWRAAMLGWGVGAASAHWFFAYVVVGTLAAITLEPWIVARRRPWRRVRHRGG